MLKACEIKKNTIIEYKYFKIWNLKTFGFCITKIMEKCPPWKTCQYNSLSGNMEKKLSR